MKKTIAVGPGLTPDWLRKKIGIMKAIDEQLLLGLERPGSGLTLDQLQRVVEHRNPFLKKEDAAVLTSFKHDKTKDGWTLLEPGPKFNGQQFAPDIVEFLKPGGLLKSGESSVNGEVMKQRAKELNANLGQRHAEYLLEHQELIPNEWRGKYYLVFPGTVWRDSDGRRGVPCLGWDGDGWYLYFSWLGNGWDSDGRLVLIRE